MKRCLLHPVFKVHVLKKSQRFFDKEQNNHERVKYYQLMLKIFLYTIPIVWHKMHSVLLICIIWTRFLFGDNIKWEIMSFVTTN